MSTDYAQILKDKVCTDIELFKHWYDFQYNIERYLPPEKLQQAFPEYPDNLRDIMLKNPVTRPNLKITILETCQLGNVLNYDISSPALSYAMLSPETVKKMINVVGALVCHSDIAKIIGRTQLEEVCDLVGREVYMFVIKRSLLFWKKIPNLPKFEHGLGLKERIGRYGKMVFEYIVHGLPDSAIKRLNIRTGMEFQSNLEVSEEEFNKALALAKYAIVNFFRDDEGAKLCLK